MPIPNLSGPGRKAPGPAETPAQREVRLARERKLIGEARAEVEAGLGLSGDDVEAWLDKLDSDEVAPIPEKPRHLG